jgi:hypothetical protein
MKTLGWFSLSGPKGQQLAPPTSPEMTYGDTAQCHWTQVAPFVLQFPLFSKSINSADATARPMLGLSSLMLDEGQEIGLSLLPPGDRSHCPAFPFEMPG